MKLATKNSVDRRSAILAAAQKIFDERGFAEATIDDVAHKAGIAKGSVYNYFASKHDLFRNVYFAALAEQDAQMAQQIVDLPISATEKIKLMLDDWFSKLSYHKQIGGLILEFWATAARQQREGEVASDFGEMFGRWRNLLIPIIAEGARAGEFQLQFEPAVAARLIIAIGYGITLQTIMDNDSTVDEQVLAAMKKSILAGLKAGAILNVGKGGV